ncbi:MAG: LysR family transcriptional regulator [Betaproteobacteria bacterium]|nr:LysR family transcriptional regulator [Betaproteobacteria bacterium]
MTTNRLPPLQALRAFEAVARLGGVVLAAEELAVTHSAISHQLKGLEEFLGAALLRREGRRLVLTEDGRVYASQIRRSLSDVAQATQAMLSKPRENELLLTVLPSFGVSWLVPRLPRLRKALAGFALHVRASLEVVDLRLERVDAAIRLGSGFWPELQCEQLMEDSYVVVAAPHFRGGRLPRTPREILAAPRVHDSDSWNQWLTEAGLAPRRLDGPRFNDSNLMLEAVRLGQALCLTRRSLVHKDLCEGRLVRLSPIEPPYPDAYWLVWPLRLEAAPKIEKLRNWLRKEIAAYLAEAETDAASRSH